MKLEQRLDKAVVPASIRRTPNPRSVDEEAWRALDRWTRDMEIVVRAQSEAIREIQRVIEEKL